MRFFFPLKIKSKLATGNKRKCKEEMVELVLRASK